MADAFDPLRFDIPLPGDGQRVHLALVPRPKSFGLWWSILDDDGWCDGGHVSTHRTREAARAKSREVADWIEQRDTPDQLNAQPPAGAKADDDSPPSVVRHNEQGSDA